MKREKTYTQTLVKRRVLPADELKRLTDFFTLLLEIDRKKNITKTYDKQTK